jgi:hypothetical protein
MEAFERLKALVAAMQDIKSAAQEVRVKVLEQRAVPE